MPHSIEDESWRPLQLTAAKEPEFMPLLQAHNTVEVKKGKKSGPITEP